MAKWIGTKEAEVIIDGRVCRRVGNEAHHVRLKSQRRHPSAAYSYPHESRTGRMVDVIPLSIKIILIVLTILGIFGGMSYYILLAGGML